MLRFLPFAFLPFAVPPSAAAPDSVTRISAAPAREGWFVCDAISGPYAAFAGKPDAASTSVITMLDRRTGRFDTQAYQVGEGDPGAGQIFWSLSQAGHPVGAIHGVNPGMIDDNGATVPPITSVSIAGKQLECRFLSHTHFIGIDSRRSVVLTDAPQGMVYQSFDFRKRGAITHPDGVQRSNVATLRMTKGSAVISGFRFTNRGYSYALDAAENGPATLTVTRAGRLIGIDRFVGYTIARSSSIGGSAAVSPLGPEAVWNGKGLDACRVKQAAIGIDACLIETMRRNGASIPSIEFTQRLIGRNRPGYLSAWKQAGPVGIATVVYPFRANTDQGTMLIPVGGDPIDADGYTLTTDDKIRADYRAAQAVHPDSFPVPPGDVTIGKSPTGNLRILVTTPTADCHACAPNGSVVIGYDFDEAGHFLSAALVMVA